MKTVKNFVSTVLMMILVPVLTIAHPGHDHTGGFMETFLHFSLTYYVYIFLFLIMVAGIIKIMLGIRSKQKKEGYHNIR